MAKNEFVDMFVKAIGEVTNGLGIKARELAEKLGISKGTLSNYMKDSTFKGRNWSHARVILLVLYFGEERVHDLKSFKKCVCEELSAKEKCQKAKRCRSRLCRVLHKLFSHDSPGYIRYQAD